jgi:hypothetical protein
MVKRLKIALLFSVFGIFNSCIPCIMCGFDDPVCYEEIFNNKIHFGEYYSNKTNFKIDYTGSRYQDAYGRLFSYDSLQYDTYQFSFREDSSFSYLKIQHQRDAESIVIRDTVMMLNGSFKINKDAGLPWYVLELNADFVYEKEIKDSLDGILYFTDFNENNFEEFEDKFFTNTDKHGSTVFRDGIDGTSGCFTMHTKLSYLEPSACNAYKYEDVYWHIKKSKTFCLKNEPNSMKGSL